MVCRNGSSCATRLEEHKTFVDAAAAAGVRHLVYISFYGAAKDATFTLARQHYATEEHIKASGMTWTILRDNLYLDFVLRDPADHLGKQFSYHAETVEEAYRSRASYGAPYWQVEVWKSTYTAIAAGELAGVTDDVRLLTGRPPMSLDDLLRQR